MILVIDIIHNETTDTMTVSCWLQRKTILHEEVKKKKTWKAFKSYKLSHYFKKEDINSGTEVIASVPSIN